MKRPSPVKWPIQTNNYKCSTLLNTRDAKRLQNSTENFEPEKIAYKICAKRSKNRKKCTLKCKRLLKLHAKKQKLALSAPEPFDDEYGHEPCVVHVMLSWCLEPPEIGLIPRVADPRAIQLPSVLVLVSDTNHQSPVREQSTGISGLGWLTYWVREYCVTVSVSTASKSSRSSTLSSYSSINSRRSSSNSILVTNPACSHAPPISHVSSSNLI